MGRTILGTTRRQVQANRTSNNMESLAPIQPDLDGVLELALAPCRERLLSSYPLLEHLLAGRSSAIVYPAARMARVAADKLRHLGVKVIGFGDSNPALWGQKVDELPVWSP